MALIPMRFLTKFAIAIIGRNFIPPVAPRARRPPGALSMHRPDKTELEFALPLALVVAPFAYFAIRMVLALIGM